MSKSTWEVGEKATFTRHDGKVIHGKVGTFTSTKSNIWFYPNEGIGCVVSPWQLEEVKEEPKSPNERAMQLYKDMRYTKDCDPVIKNKLGTVTKSMIVSSNGKDKVLPAGCTIQGDFGGDFGLYAISFDEGIMSKVKVKLEDLIHIHFEYLDGPLENNKTT